MQNMPLIMKSINMLPECPLSRSDPQPVDRPPAFDIPKQKVIFGPRQVVARINQEQTISPQITLWNQLGSQVIWGTLMVIPIEESLIYVRPLYLRSSGGRIPELTRVIVAHQNQIVMERTLDAALARVFRTGAGAPPPQEVPSPSPESSSATTQPGAPPVADNLGRLAAEAR